MSIPELSFIIYSGIFVLGLVLGSYLNSWMWRVHEGKYQFGGRSMCVHCSRGLAWYENIPLFSFVFLRGRCYTCKKPIPPDYFFVEFAAGCLLLFVSVFILESGLSYKLFFRDLFFVAVLLVAFVYDFKYSLVLPGLTYVAAVLGGLVNYFYFGYTLQSLVLGLVIGGGFFLAQYAVSKGRWVGGGDVKLGAMMGLWLGWPGILVALFLSYVVGALVAIPLLALKKKKMGSEIPFGTFLAVGTFVVIFWGERILKWYLGLMK